jgi:tripartite-type tricarboxylate transporter receptor subunit TctC
MEHNSIDEIFSIAFSLLVWTNQSGFRFIREERMRIATRLFGFISVAALSVAAVATAQAQTFPDHAVKLVIPYPAGGPTDLVGRLVADRLSKEWNQPVLVENKPGASATIGSRQVVEAPKDGYTLLLGNNSSQGAYELLNPSTTPYKTLDDFASVGLVGLLPSVMVVGAHIEANTLREFIDYVKANPGKVNYASGSIGSAPHLSAEMLNMIAGLDLKHIPFNGTAPAMQALVAGAVDVYMGGVSSVMPQVEAGYAKAMGAVAAERLPQLPDLPTLKEQGVDVEYTQWYGLLAPAGTPDALLDRINADLNKVMDQEAPRAELEKLGFVPTFGSRADMTKVVSDTIDMNREIIEKTGIPVQ